MRYLMSAVTLAGALAFSTVTMPSTAMAGTSTEAWSSLSLADKLVYLSTYKSLLAAGKSRQVAAMIEALAAELGISMSAAQQLLQAGLVAWDVAGTISAVLFINPEVLEHRQNEHYNMLLGTGDNFDGSAMAGDGGYYSGGGGGSYDVSSDCVNDNGTSSGGDQYVHVDCYGEDEEPSPDEDGDAGLTYTPNEHYLFVDVIDVDGSQNCLALGPGINAAWSRPCDEPTNLGKVEWTATFSY